MRFSERNGYKFVRETIQKESMDDDLKTRLWSLLDIFLYSKSLYTTKIDNSLK